MAHTIQDKKKLLARVRRIKGQVQALETALENETGCSDILQLIASCRGAMNGLMLVVLEGHVRMHVLDPDQPIARKQADAALELMDVLKTYLR
jgi:DNA-binding FrmR family transcriptional regulator